MPDFRQKTHVVKPLQDIRKRFELLSTRRVLLINRLGGIGDILCARLLFEDLKQVPGVGEVTFAVPRKYLPLIQDHPFIDHKIAVESLNMDTVEDHYVLIKDITMVPGKVERRAMPEVTRNRADVLAGSIGLSLTSHRGHLTFTDEEMTFAREYLDRLGPGKKIGIAPVTSHPSKDIPIPLVQDLIGWCRQEGALLLIFHDRDLPIKGGITCRGLGLREWMAVTSLLDAVVAPASAMFWISQLTARPTVAVFGCEDLRVFGKYHLNLRIIERRAKGTRLPYSTVVGKQDRVEPFKGDWVYCPCWDALKCAYKEWGDYPPLCLESIQPEEITRELKEILNAPDPAEAFDRDYFMKRGHLGWYNAEAWGTDNTFHQSYAGFIIDVLGLSPGDRLLDVGAAFGDLVYHLRQQGIDAHGVDISKYTVKTRHVSTLKQADVSMGLPYRDGFFDVVISRDCLEHIPETRVLDALNHIERVLKPAGLAFLAIATDYFDKETQKRVHKIKQDPTHVCIRDTTWWHWKLKKAGLIPDDAVGGRVSAHPLVSGNRWEIFTARSGNGTGVGKDEHRGKRRLRF